MKKTMTYIPAPLMFVALLFTVLLLRTPVVADDANKGKDKVALQAVKWEYRVSRADESGKLEPELNKLGGEGWEYAGSVPYGSGAMHYLIYKRVKQ